MKLNNVFLNYEKQIHICKKCFKPFNFGIINLFGNCNYCIDCFKQLEPNFKKFKVNGCRGIAIYDYDEIIKDNLYQFKGCFDYELRDYFLNNYSKLLKLKFHDYIMIPIPSNMEDDDLRGFNHVIEIFSFLQLPIETVLYKSMKYKQSEQNADDRIKIKKILKLHKVDNIKNKNILLVDDVCTTGNTLEAAIDLIKKVGVKKIKILVMAKTKFNKENE